MKIRDDIDHIRPARLSCHLGLRANLTTMIMVRPQPHRDFDPSAAAVTKSIFGEARHEIIFPTSTKEIAPSI
jgi:hypothetical protein